jgi:hypothetical protein
MNSLKASFLTTAASLVLPLVASLPASAVSVTVDLIDYDVTVFTGSYTSNPSLFQQLPASGKMPWWGDNTGDLASKFAKEIYNKLGNGPSPGFSPVFAYDRDSSTIFGISQKLDDPLSQKDESIDINAGVDYAIIASAGTGPMPAPGPLPIIGAIAAFSYSRKIRNRISSESA